MAKKAGCKPGYEKWKDMCINFKYLKPVKAHLFGPRGKTYVIGMRSYYFYQDPQHWYQVKINDGKWINLGTRANDKNSALRAAKGIISKQKHGY